MNTVQKNTDEEKFHQYLSEFQPDLKKLIGSKRKDFHAMSIEEILSDFNYNAIKGKEKIINYRDDKFTEFNFETFKYVICCFLKKSISWYHCKARDDKFKSRRLDFEHNTEDGKITSFELACETLGCEDLDNFDDSYKYKYLMKLMKDYSNWLTSNEIQIMSLLSQGYKQIDMVDVLGCTHQAISFNMIKLKEKISCRFKFDFFKDESWEKISIGKQSIEDLFKKECR